MDLLYITALDVTLQRHLFSPRPFASTGLEYTGGQKTSDYKSALTVTNTAGVRQQLPWGGEVVARALVDFVNAINGNVNDGESAGLVLSGSMPLLRGFGMINLEPLKRLGGRFHHHATPDGNRANPGERSQKATSSVAGLSRTDRWSTMSPTATSAHCGLASSPGRLYTGADHCTGSHSGARRKLPLP